MKLPRLYLAILLAAFALPAFASPTDDESVIRHCGHPLSDQRGNSQVTGEYQRNLFYPNDVIIHFAPVDGGWTLTGAWLKHVAVTREGLASNLSCVRVALEEAAKAPKPEIDPTIAQQTTQPRTSSNMFGIPFLWLILALIVAVLIFAVLPSRRAAPPTRPEPRSPRRLPDYERHSSSVRRAVKDEEI